MPHAHVLFGRWHDEWRNRNSGGQDDDGVAITRGDSSYGDGLPWSETHEWRDSSAGPATFYCPWRHEASDGEQLVCVCVGACAACGKSLRHGANGDNDTRRRRTWRIPRFRGVCTKVIGVRASETVDNFARCETVHTLRARARARTFDGRCVANLTTLRLKIRDLGDRNRCNLMASVEIDVQVTIRKR